LTPKKNVLFLKENVAILLAVERRVEVNKIDRFIFYAAAQHVEIVP
jgi:hypothetical protein